MWPHRFQKLHRSIDRFLLGFGQRLLPRPELIGIFDIPSHN